MRSEADTTRAVEQYADMIRRICLYHLKGSEDTEDIFQTVFLKYMMYEGKFGDEEHEKAWLIRVAINACKDHMRSLFRRRQVDLSEWQEEVPEADPDLTEVLEAVLALPKKYKDVIYLYYYEGYSAAEIGGIIDAKESTVFSLLSRGRAKLKVKLGGDGIDE